MKRTVITVDGNGRLSIPSNLEDLWMNESELIDMLYITAPKLNAVIRAIYKERRFLWRPALFSALFIRFCKLKI